MRRVQPGWSSAGDEPDEPVLELGVGLVADGDVEPCGGGEDALGMAESKEGMVTLVGAHARLTDAAEGQMMVGQMHEGVIDAAATKLQAVHHAVLLMTAGGEEVEGQWVRATADEAYGLLQIGYREYGQYGAEDFLTHYGILRMHVVKHGRCYAKRLAVCFSTKQDLLREDELLQAMEMMPVDNLSVGRIGERMSAVHRLGLFSEMLDESIVHALLNEHIVGSHACLASIHPFAEGDTSGCQAQVGASRDDDRRLPGHLKKRVYSLLQ